VLEVSALNQFYGESHILRDVELRVADATCTCLMGRNGVGKTTLLKSVMGLLRIRSGQIRFGSHELQGAPVRARARHGIGYVPQGRDIFPQMTVEENLRLGLPMRDDGLREIPESVLKLFPVLATMLRRRGGDLSGGQQQQLAIGRALVTQPRLLLLDEPTEGLQPNVVHEIGDVLVKLNREQEMTILVVEQKLGFARRVAHDYCIMEKGAIVASGAMSSLDEEQVKQYLMV
jgi:urea transport system ATP-binding protein